MHIREITLEDIPQIMHIRMAVKENILSNPDLVTAQDCETFITQRGKGWVGEVAGKVVGFSIADLVENNVWALFLLPEYEGKGIGKALHHVMLDWYFAQTQKTIWLGTSPNTRAEGFYKKLGWRAIGFRKNGEVHFEMTAQDWQNRPL